MFEVLKWVIGISYLSIALELLFFHVPSVASTVNIWKPDNELLSVYSERFQSLFYLPKFQKILLFVVPLLLIYGTFFFPIYYLWLQPMYQFDLLYYPSDFIRLFAMALIILGRWFSFVSVLRIRKENQQKGSSFTLHTKSIFALTRNPIQVGMYIMLLGIWLCLPSLIFAVGILVYIAYIHFKILMEEDFLTHKYGKAYQQYFLSTKRYLF